MKIIKTASLFFIRMILPGLVFIGAMFLYSREFTFFSNTFGARELILRALLAGLLVGLVAGYLLQKSQTYPLEKTRILILAVFLSVFFSPLIAGLANRIPGMGTGEQQSFYFYKAQPYVSSRFGIIQGDANQREGNYLFIIKDFKLERLKTRVEVSSFLRQGDSITLVIHQGCLGYDWYDGE